ncbi:MAG: arylesterase, partial [Gammaproteobacteria bacterium]|nr:arylesterase [Gammaproteobacteria bacterium]
IVNASIAGETTAGGLARIDSLLARNRPQLVIVELGGNDGLRGLTLSQIEHNLYTITQRITMASASTLLAEIYLPPNYGAAYTEQFQEIFNTVAAQDRVELLPFLLADVATSAEYMQDDGVHPNAAAQAIILENVWHSLQTLLSR